jgi:hypothetical protein
MFIEGQIKLPLINLTHLITTFQLEIEADWIQNLTQSMNTTFLLMLRDTVKVLSNNKTKTISFEEAAGGTVSWVDPNAPSWTDREMEVFLKTTILNVISTVMIRNPIALPKVLDLRDHKEWPTHITQDAQPTGFLL